LRQSLSVNIIVAILPVFLFLLILYLLDSYKLVRYPTLIFSFILGTISAAIALVSNLIIQNKLGIGFDSYSKYIAPIVEELCKTLMIVILIKKKKAGFLIDAGIYGFTIGAGFGVAENVYYLLTTEDSNFLLWIFRGLGTAIMHSGNAAIISILIMGAFGRERNLFRGIIPALVITIVLHSIYNQFDFYPLYHVAAVAVLVPVCLIFIFNLNKKQLQHWLEMEFYSEAELLVMMGKGEFSHSKAGVYLKSLKEHFPSEVIVDMYCFMHLYFELSIAFKRNLMLSENELPSLPVEGAEVKLKELKQLIKNIGKSGELALAPVVRITYRDLWKLSGVKG